MGVLLLFVIAVIITALREGLESRQRELEELAVHDPLTGVGNYRLLSDRLEYEISRHRCSGKSMTLMLLDLSGFKHANDMYGHLTVIASCARWHVLSPRRFARRTHLPASRRRRIRS